MTRRPTTCCIVFFTVSLFAFNVFAGGFENNVIGIKGSAMGCAFTGIADDASAVYYNPGGLILTNEESWQGEIYTWFSNDEQVFRNNSVRSKSENFVVIPGFFIKKSYGGYAVGFGNYISFAGGGVKYDDFYPQGYDMESFAGFSAFTAAVAYKISPKLSIGAGASLYIGAMGSKELQEIAPEIYMNIESEYEGLAGYGCNLGLMYKFSEEFYAGASVMSKIPIELDGEVEVAGIDGSANIPRSINDSDVEFTLPYIIKIGVGYKPENSDLTLCMVIGYFMWGDLDKIKITTAGTLEEVKTSYNDSCVLGAGMEYRLSDKFALRSGLYYTERAIKKEKNNPAFSDFNRLNPSIGIAYNFSDSLEINVNANYTYAFEEKFNNSKLKQRNMILLTGVRFQF